MKRWMRCTCLSLVMVTVGFAFAENPFVGSWKLNQERSHLSGETLKFSSAGNGMIRETIAEGTYTFKVDGQSYPALFGDTEQWEKLSGHSWKTTVHGNGGFIYTDSLNISDDGRTLTITEDGTHPDGTSFHDTVVYTRLAGSKDLMGTWKSKTVKSSSSRVLEFSANGDDGIIWKIPDIKASLNAKFDGKDHTPDGPTVPKGLTIAMTKTGKNSFHVNEKMNGKSIYQGTYTVSADGATLTEVGRPAGQAQAETSVYDKQ